MDRSWYKSLNWAILINKNQHARPLIKFLTNYRNFWDHAGLQYKPLMLTDDDVSSSSQKLLDGLEPDPSIAAGDDNVPASLVGKVWKTPFKT